MNNLIKAIKTVFKESYFIYIGILASAIVAYLIYWLLYRTTTIPTILYMGKTGEYGRFSILFAAVYLVTTALIIPLAGISVAFALWLYSNSNFSSKKNVFSVSGGMTAALLGAGCPVCGAFLLSLLGVAGGLSILPLKGIELKFLSIGLLLLSIWYSAKKIVAFENCSECSVVSGKPTSPEVVSPILEKNEFLKTPTAKGIVISLDKIIIFILTFIFLLNQLLIGSVSAKMGLTPSGGNLVANILGIKSKSSKVIIAPTLNPDGKTTSLKEQVTITEVPGNPKTGDALADAKVVMIATGKPFYAPDDISFDDPINAQKKWGAYATSVKLSSDLENRYKKLINTMVCSYCCGSPNSVTLNAQCACAHATAVRGFYRYMLQNYSNYTDEELVGESHRWYAIWYPKGMLEDYLLATGNTSALPHNTHGGAGSDGMHGLANKS